MLPCLFSHLEPTVLQPVLAERHLVAGCDSGAEVVLGGVHLARLVAERVVELARGRLESRLGTFPLGVAVRSEVWLLGAGLLLRWGWLLSLRVRRTEREGGWRSGLARIPVGVRRRWSEHWEHSWRAYSQRSSWSSHLLGRRKRRVRLRSSRRESSTRRLFGRLVRGGGWLLLLLLVCVPGQVVGQLDVPLLHQGLHLSRNHGPASITSRSLLTNTPSG